MKVYFSAAIAQKDRFGKYYEEIVDELKRLGHTVYQDTTEVTLEEAVSKSDTQRIDYYKQVLDWIAKADLVVLEVSFPSTLHIGHEVSLALEKGKPVVALYYKGFEPSFFLGKAEDRLLWVEYDDENVRKELMYAIETASEQQDTRFNFFISPRIAGYLDWVAKNKRIPRAVYLRRLIEEDMQQNPE